jgi:AcrR family transcriptional regulator
LLKPSPSDTKLKILDAAERLFAHQGYHYTSMRAITTAAEVNLAAVNYHFGSKETLLEEVFKRRLLPLNAVRLERLEVVRDQARQENRTPEIADALRAFIEPTIRFRFEEPGAVHFSTLVSRALSDPDPAVRDIFVPLIMPLFHLLFELLHQSLPDLDRDAVFWRLHFALGSAAHTMHLLGRLELIPEGFEREVDCDTLLEQLMGFVTAGVTQ